MQIFLSYRRSDTRFAASRIYERLAQVFGDENVFRDITDIPAGHDFRGVIHQALGQCDVLLVLVGPTWIDVRDELGKSRLENPDDFVRIEVEMGLSNSDILVIPILVGDAEMPKEEELPDALRSLVYRNAKKIRDDPDFNNDVNRLISDLKRHGMQTGILTQQLSTHNDTEEIGLTDVNVVSPVKNPKRSEQPSTDTKNRFGTVSTLRTRMGILGELFAFLWAAKMWWLIPMIVALVIFALLIVLGSASGGGPLIYTLF